MRGTINIEINELWNNIEDTLNLFKHLALWTKALMEHKFGHWTKLLSAE